MKSIERSRICDTRKSLRRAGERAEENQTLGKMKWAKQRQDQRTYFNATHHYVLRIGDVYTEQKVTMTGWEAKVANSGFEKKFIQELDRNIKPRPRLHRWCLEESARD